MYFSADFKAISQGILEQVDQEVYRNNLKSREFGKEAPQNFDSERATIVQAQGAIENRNFEVKPTTPKTDSSGCFGMAFKDAEKGVKSEIL